MGTTSSSSLCRLSNSFLEEVSQIDRCFLQLTSSVPLDSRPEYHRVQIRPTSRGLEAVSTGGQRSSRTVSLAGANGLLELPASSEGEKEKSEGDVVQCVVVGDFV